MRDHQRLLRRASVTPPLRVEMEQKETQAVWLKLCVFPELTVSHRCFKEMWLSPLLGSLASFYSNWELGAYTDSAIFSFQLIFIITVKQEVCIWCTWQFLWGVITAAAVSFHIYILNPTSHKWLKQNSSCWVYKQISLCAACLCVCGSTWSLFLSPQVFTSLSSSHSFKKPLHLTKSRQLSNPWSHLPSFIFPQSLSSSLSPSHTPQVSPSLSLRSDLVSSCLKPWLTVCVMFVTVYVFIWQCVSVWGPEASLVSLPACLPPN